MAEYRRERPRFAYHPPPCGLPCERSSSRCSPPSSLARKPPHPKRTSHDPDVSRQNGCQAARTAGLSVLAMVRAELGSLDQVRKIVKVVVTVDAAPGFTELPQVANGFSDLMVEVFGDTIGKHARSAIDVAELPNRRRGERGDTGRRGSAMLPGVWPAPSIWDNRGIVSARANIECRLFRSVRDEERADEQYWRSRAPADRLAMMWQLTLDAWAFTGDRVAESRLPRHIVSIHRPTG